MSDYFFFHFQNFLYLYSVKLPVSTMDLFTENVKARMSSADAFTLVFFILLELLGNKAVIEWCMSEGMIGKRVECPKCGCEMQLSERRDRRMDMNGDAENKAKLLCFLLFETGCCLDRL